MTGAIIGLTIHQPEFALPLALASHFVLDALPHFGERNDSHVSRVFRGLLLIDVVLCTVLVVWLAVMIPPYWPLAVGCAFLAASPDFMWFTGYLRVLQHKPKKKLKNPIIRFHSWIQWYQLPPGALVEIVWAVSAITILWILVALPLLSPK